MGILAILLGILAVFADDPYDKTKASINTKELSLISADEISNVKVDYVADAIIKSKFDYRLIDLRKESEYAKYHIPSAENIQVETILKSDLARNENILLYSDNDIEAAQAWFLLKADNYRAVNILKGGLEKWQKEILFPVCTCGESPSTEQKHKHNMLAEVSKFFGGKIQTDNIVENTEKVRMPELAEPTSITLKKAKGKKKREGC
jgi:rhodanese-related sulfurtransferase